MKNYTLILLVLALCAVPLVADAGPDATDSDRKAVEAELREELSSLRSRLLKLEAMLDSLQEGESATAAEPEEAPAVVATSPAPVDLAIPLDTQTPGSASPQLAAAPKPQAVSYAEPSQEEAVGVASSGGQAISLTGLIDTYWTHNTNNPSDGQNTLYYTNPNATGFGLNQAKLEIDASGDGPIGFRSDIWFGSGARLFREGLTGPGPLDDMIYIQQAYGYYQFGNGAELDVGAFGTIAGLEVAESHLNWNYTRGILWAWNEPFSHLGAKLSVPVTDTFTSTFMVVNGFDITQDNNTGKSYGLQGSFAPSDRFNTTLTWINGPENNPGEPGWRKNLSWNFYAGLHDRFEVMANLDYIQDNNTGVRSTSWGMGGYARAHLSDQVRIAYRIEFLDDKDGRSTGMQQNLRENTFTFEVQPVKEDPRFLTRLEYRRDWSDIAFFGCTDCDGGLSKNQNTITLGFMWVFGPK